MLFFFNINISKHFKIIKRLISNKNKKISKAFSKPKKKKNTLSIYLVL